MQDLSVPDRDDSIHLRRAARAINECEVPEEDIHVEVISLAGKGASILSSSLGKSNHEVARLETYYHRDEVHRDDVSEWRRGAFAQGDIYKNEVILAPISPY
jgi:hypothetical protein